MLLTTVTAEMPILLRLFADCADHQQAQTLSDAVTEQLSAFSVTPTETPSRYWKIPDYFEFCFALSPDNQHTFYSLLNYANHWTHSGDDTNHSAIWLRKEHNQFLLTEIAWVELIFY